MKKRILIIALSIFILTSTLAIADSNEKNLNHGKNTDPIGSINFTDRVVYVLDHTNDPVNGNWIIMKSPHKEKRIQLPHPIKFTYSGPKSKEYKGISGTLYVKEKSDYKVTYPSTSLYLTHPVYLPCENVSMSFYGEKFLKGEVEIYLFNATSKSAHGILDSLNAGEIENLDKLFQSADGKYRKYSTTLGKNGDLLDYDFGPLDAGQYCIVMIQKNKDKSLTVLSATAVVVAEYDISVSSPKSIAKGENLDINMNLKNAPDQSNCTYGAVLIKKQAYKANIEINSDGTKNGTSVIVNDIDVINEFGINSSNYRSKFTRGELQTEIQTLIGEVNGALAIGEKGENTLSLTAFDLPVGNYYLFVGAYNPGQGLVGLTQLSVEIKPRGNPINNNHGNWNNENSGNGNTDGGEVISPEPPKNIKAKEICYEYISKGKKISYKFIQKVTSIDYVKFDSKKNSGKIITIVEKLKGKSSLANLEPEGEVYEHINIWVGNGKFANSQNIENATIGFRVNQDWIKENHIDAKSIALQHFKDNKWNSLPTKKVNEDKECIYFEAETPGFSPFAITGQKNIVIIDQKAEETQKLFGVNPQNIPGIATFSGSFTQENINSGLSKIASFIIGFLGITLVGGLIVINKKMGFKR
ncbi:MAG TPA: TIGR04279 domain-containing protein [Methanosarcina sp.]|nr:TIGR04279 domain-containing protein [Methanosarcina sp.]